MTSTCSECGLLTTTSWTLARCQQLAKSNEPPNDAETAFLRAVVPHTAARLACLQDEISRLRERLALLETEQAQLSDYHSQNLTILSPLRRMPSELMTEIFSWSLPGVDEPNGDVTSGVEKKSPWVLARVSSRWRNISLSTPSLWSLVQIWGSKVEDSVLELVRTQVERARQLKIHFYGTEESNSAAQIKLFDFLSEHALRWEEFSVQLTPALVPRLGVLRGRLPSLKRLWIQWDKEESHLGDDPIKCFEAASSLLDVGMQAYLMGRSTPIHFPAHQLTSYRLRGPWEMHQQVLKMAPNVVEAQIFTSSQPEASGATLNLLHLRRLYVSEPTVLDHIRAPRLDEIAIWTNRPEGMVDRLDSFLRRSSCTTLRQVHFRGLPHTGATAEILRKYPSITSLVLTFIGNGTEEQSTSLHDHLTMLCLQNESMSVLSPHLIDISLGSTVSIPIDYPRFLKMSKVLVRIL
ncbi:hypothetical protein FB45DRAFT_953411 [Roridomyces roridus]|uniref:F-box domain-containing protein n=1 Tax=Roridomyces roridus TaxID=1738132 RepID=A0AAD7AZP9_9AGAR|nr:hypothetical protein FB45DRAFT_953411 [Roridomyces roridus]